MVIKFKLEGGKATSFEVRMDEGQVIASGKRLP